MSRSPAGRSVTVDVDAVTDAVLTASRLLVAISARSLASVEETVTLPQFRLLVMLESRGPLKLVRLAEHLGVNPSTATRMVERLVTAGLITRQAQQTSRREQAVGLTEAGAGVVSEVTERRRTEIAKVVARIPEPTREGLVAALTAFAEAGGEPPVNDRADTLWG